MTIAFSPPNSARMPEETAAPRMGPLAVLPVFFKLEGKPVLLVGGSDAAAWKAELLAASGAHVCVIAEVLEPLFQSIIVNAPSRGSYFHLNRPWSLHDFAGKALAIADIDDEAEAKAFSCAAKAAGVPFNVIDKPAYCQFQFGSIVNRSPVVVSISTDGAAPILGQAIRRRIEMLLPPALADWAGFAKSIRSKVGSTLKAGAPRRAFWEQLAERAFASPFSEAGGETLLRQADFVSSSKNGKVTLVGAGPGDAELLTIKAVRALQAADIILYDDLVSKDVLELARREAKRMLVGKRGGQKSCRQEDINAMMLSLAKAGKHVVRLKSGDPMIFGRAGEEVELLEAQGIEVSVVPGITAALAMASTLGVSLTHRDHARSVRFVTGHNKNGDVPDDIDWHSISDAKATTIFYMGGRTAKTIYEKLLQAGMDDKTPVVAASAVGTALEQTRFAKLSTLPQIVE
ncbi:MAG: siroheme synthase CysG, partial [Notoacmeibacter sp.]